MFYTVYKITNQINNKIYIGVHKTNDLSDNYMGSGKALANAKAKYGIENFKKEILFIFDTAAEMYAKEAELVNESFVAANTTYNLKVGGKGGWDHVNANPLNPAYRQVRVNNGQQSINKGFAAVHRKVREDAGYRAKLEEHLVELRRRLALAYPEGTFKGRCHTRASKRKISQAHKGKALGIKNSQYGTMWITDGCQNKKLQKSAEIPQGWRKGRSCP